MSWRRLRRHREPFSRVWGSDRGLPVDRVYIERFLAEHAEDVRGEALEIHGSAYTERYGAERLTTAHVLDVDPSNPAATIVGDLSQVETLAEGRFDCFVLTQTLQFIPDAEGATANAYRSLSPGGVLLLTVPVISQLEAGYDDFWRWTPRGLEELLARVLPPEAERQIRSYGNVFTAIAFLAGLAAEDLSDDDYSDDDPQYPIVVCARVRRPS